METAEPIIDELQKFIDKEGKVQKRSSDEQYAQKLHKFEEAMKKLEDFKKECASAAELDNAPDPKEEDPKGADGKDLKESKDDKCPKCGATDISFNKNTGLLRCNFCRHEFVPEYVSGLEEDISNLSGEVVASGALDIQEECDDIVLL